MTIRPAQLYPTPTPTGTAPTTASTQRIRLAVSRTAVAGPRLLKGGFPKHVGSRQNLPRPCSISCPTISGPNPKIKSRQLNEPAHPSPKPRSRAPRRRRVHHTHATFSDHDDDPVLNGGSPKCMRSRRGLRVSNLGASIKRLTPSHHKNNLNGSASSLTSRRTAPQYYRAYHAHSTPSTVSPTNDVFHSTHL